MQTRVHAILILFVFTIAIELTKKTISLYISIHIHLYISIKFVDCEVSWTLILEKTGLQNLYNMLHYSIDQKACRRKLIGKHFGEVWDSAKCNEMCDNCVLKKNGGMEPNYLQFVCTTKYSFLYTYILEQFQFFQLWRFQKSADIIFFVLFIYFVVVCGVVLQGTVEQKNNMLVMILRQVCI